MTPWTCGIEECGAEFQAPAGLIEHQVENHDPSECGVCGQSFPAGYPAIRHAFSAHTRADYLRAYEANSDDIRVREEIIERIEESIDVQQLLASLEIESPSVPAGD